jgi:hypothetical protein
MPTDTPLQDDDTREIIARALREYAAAESARHVLLYAARKRLTWNELQRQSSLPSDALRQALHDVEAHLRRRLRAYLQ